MTSDDIIKLVRGTDQSQDDSLRATISKVLEAYWVRGYEKRSWVEKRFNFIRKRAKSRFDEEIEQIREATSKEGYSGEWLKAEVYKRYLLNDNQ